MSIVPALDGAEVGIAIPCTSVRKDAERTRGIIILERKEEKGPDSEGHNGSLFTVYYPLFLPMPKNFGETRDAAAYARFTAFDADDHCGH